MERSKARRDWLLSVIDKNKDGKIFTAEYSQFQEYKKQHPDWQRRLRAALAN